MTVATRLPSSLFYFHLSPLGYCIAFSYAPPTMAARPMEARRSKRQATTRKRSLYQEVDTDDELEADSEADFEPQPRRPQPKESPQPPRKKQRTTKRVTKPQTRSTAAKRKSKSPGKTVIGAARKGRKATGESADAQNKFTGPSDGRLPPWATLPVDILRDIFVFASQPLHERDSEHNIAWLMQTARNVCRAFAQPALEAYYESPALLNPRHLHDLEALLRMPEEKRFMDYNVKIRNIETNVQNLAYTSYGRAPFHLSSLTLTTPRLQHLAIKHPVDEPPYRPVKFQKWHYPRDLHQALSSRGIRLKSFRWSRTMINTSNDELTSEQPPNLPVQVAVHPSREGHWDIYRYMSHVHLADAFQSLEEVTLCGFNQSDSSPKAITDMDEYQTRSVQNLQSSLTLLPNLRDVTLISCDLLRDKFFETLPTQLQRLELSNCRYVNSDMLSDFLSRGGSQLHELILNHNIALDLAFLPGLKAACPSLETLKVDAHFYSEMTTTYDADPLYDDLLLPDEIPSWPASLHSVELVHLQKWSMEAAVNLFRSLIDGAPNLPALRHITIQAHISIPWRDRAGFRDQWVERLQRVYLCKSEPPLAMLGSLRQWTLWNSMNKLQHPSNKIVAQATENDATEVKGGDNSDNMSLARRNMATVSIPPCRTHAGDTEFYSVSDDDKPLSKSRPRRSTRVQAAVEASASHTPSNDDDTDAANVKAEEGDWRSKPEAFVQGMCHIVDVRIDNQRPREYQMTEADFLDSEVSGDEDWTEGAVEGVEEEEDGYAW